MSTKKEKRKKPKRRLTSRDDPGQSARFIAAAKALGLDKNADAFDKAMDKIAPKKGTRSN